MNKYRHIHDKKRIDEQKSNFKLIKLVVSNDESIECMKAEIIIIIFIA